MNLRNANLQTDEEERERLDKWLKPMRELSLEPQGEAVQAANREQAVEVITEAIRRVPRERSRRQFGQRLWWGAAAAAVVAVGGAGYALSTPTGGELAAQTEQANLRQVVGRVVVTLPDGSDKIVTPDTQLASGEEVSTTAQAFASVELEDQARVDLSSATTMKLEKVVAKDHAFYLRSGRVDVNVPKVLGESRRLTVRTTDTLVSVRGTIFSVEVSEQDEQSITTVRVSRGSVAIASGGRDIVLRSGQRWSSKKASGASSGSKGAIEQPADESVATAQPSAKSGSESSLKRQNKLFEFGLRARDRGDYKKAAYWFERLMREYPSSPLIPSARTEREKAGKRLE